jgi:hypothetical protein
VALAIAMLNPLASPAQAGVEFCRSDPVVILSDGTTLDVSVDIHTDVSNVKTINYTVHGPRGVKLVAALSTPTIGFRGKEVFSYVADAEPKQYITDSKVETVNNHIAVTSYTTFASVVVLWNTSLSLQYKPVSGFNGQILRAVLRR